MTFAATVLASSPFPLAQPIGTVNPGRKHQVFDHAEILVVEDVSHRQ